MTTDLHLFPNDLSPREECHSSATNVASAALCNSSPRASLVNQSVCFHNSVKGRCRSLLPAHLLSSTEMHASSDDVVWTDWSHKVACCRHDPHKLTRQMNKPRDTHNSAGGLVRRAQLMMSGCTVFTTNLPRRAM